MSRLNLTEVLFFVLAFIYILQILNGLNIFNSWYPDQRWNSSTNSLELYERNTTSIYGTDTSAIDNITAKYSNITDKLDAGAMTNPITLVGLVFSYFGLFIDILFIYGFAWKEPLSLFIGADLAGFISMMLSIAFFIAGLYVITGRTKVE